MYMKLVVVLFVGVVAHIHVSQGEDVAIAPPSGKAAVGETPALDEGSGRNLKESLGSSKSESSWAVGEESTSESGNKVNDTKTSDGGPAVGVGEESTSESGNKVNDTITSDGVPVLGGDQVTAVRIQERQGDKTQENDKPSGTSEAAVATAEPNKTCIISNATHWSWLVKIWDKDTGKQVCTGTLITDEDILVPASCFMENTTQEVPESFYTLPKELMAIAGGGMDTDCMQVRNVSVIYPHKGYFDNSEEHDYAFLKVSPEFDVDDDDIPDIRYHLNVINSEGGLVSIHNNGPFCESPYFVDDGMNAKVSSEIHLLGMRIEDCMMIWNCSAEFDTCLSYLHPASHACLKPLTPRKCGPRDKGAPLICDEVLLGYLHQCDGELPMIFRGLNKAIKFLELEDDHVQRPGYLGRHY